jgi:stearoyl-CoA desaturase (delta-9 desaturase)
MGWFTARANFATDLRAVRDLARFPELCFLDRFDIVIALLLALGLYGFGAALETWGAQTSGMQMLIWGFFISTVVLYHCTYTINSLAHTIGSKRYDTKDDSGNSFLLAVITFGEGWHNNHHYYPASTRQGFFWWEIDLTYYLLVLLSWLGLIWDLTPVPQRVRNARQSNQAPAA